MATATATKAQTTTETTYEILQRRLVERESLTRERTDQVRALEIRRIALTRKIPEEMVRAGIAGEDTERAADAIRSEIGLVEAEIARLGDLMRFDAQIYDGIHEQRDQALEAHRAARAAAIAPRARAARLMIARGLALVQQGLDLEEEFFDLCRAESVTERFDRFAQPRLVTAVGEAVEQLVKLTPAQLEGVSFRTRAELKLHGSGWMVDLASLPK
jgi:hypothetical protein